MFSQGHSVKIGILQVKSTQVSQESRHQESQHDTDLAPYCLVAGPKMTWPGLTICGPYVIGLNGGS